MDRYKVIKRIGGGGFADVYQGIDTRTGTVVAKKELRIPSTENRERFRRERDIYLEQAQNRRVIDLLDSDVDGAAPFIIQRFAPLGSLEQFAVNRQDWRRIVQWFCDIMVGLCPIYQSGGFHGDPKPANFLLFQENSQDLVVLTDFGVAQWPNAASGPMTRSPRGTPEYMDPDLQKGGLYMWWHDIFALGKSLRELLTGYREKSWFIAVPGPPELSKLIDRMTDPNPINRPDVQSIYQTLWNLLNSPVQVPIQQPSGGRWGLVLGIGALLLAATANTYDSNAGRYRDRKGRFKGGRWD